MLSSKACDNRDRGKSSSQNAARTVVEGSCRCRSDRPNSRNYQINFTMLLSRTLRLGQSENKFAVVQVRTCCPATNPT